MVILCISMWKYGHTMWKHFVTHNMYNKGKCINKYMLKFVGIIEEKQRIYNQTCKEIIT